MNPIDTVLARLKKVKPQGKAGWKALCPAHNDRTPSLSISETADHTVLLKCWTGCTAVAIVHAIDLELCDLFPSHKSAVPGPSKAAVDHERAIYLIGQSSLDRGETLTSEDEARLTLAKQRLGVL